MGSDIGRENVGDISNLTDKLLTSMRCNQIRIGTHRFVPDEKVVFTCKGLRICAPSCKKGGGQVFLDIYVKEIVKIITHFSRKLNIIFVYTLKECGKYVRESLEMQEKSDVCVETPYYNPTDRLEPYKRIILEIESITEESKAVLRSIFERSVIEKISHSEANELLKRTASKDKAQEAGASKTDTLSETCEDIRQILIYPPGKGGISINTEDYMCLSVDQYLNDVIIDFYLKYLHINSLTPLEKMKTHIFSTFFYKRLTTTTAEDETRLSAAISSHNRVKNWTKNVNLFEKDYIIIPINEQAHWFLAIICFPHLSGPVNANTNKPVTVQKFVKKKKTIKAEMLANMYEDSLDLDDECESDDNGQLVSDNVELETTSNTNSRNSYYAIKQPLILIFDSLIGSSRADVGEKLRDYLTFEYKAKMNRTHVFDEDNMPLQIVRVPQQDNYTDCGLYLLQFVEHFFNNPIEDYHLPIVNLSDWFDTIVVTKKREEISELLKRLVEKYNPERLPLPYIPLPTQNGKLIETHEIQDKDDEDVSDWENDNKMDTDVNNELAAKVTRSMLKRTLDGINNTLHSAVKKHRSPVIIKD